MLKHPHSAEWGLNPHLILRYASDELIKLPQQIKKGSRILQFEAVSCSLKPFLAPVSFLQKEKDTEWCPFLLERVTGIEPA